MSAIAYRKEIDGLRTVAVLSVVFYHANFNIAGANLLPGGFIGVDVFFVISGYLISLIILKGLHQNSFTFKDFYERRARRILPVLFTVILVSLPFAWIALLPQAMIEYCEQIFYSIFFSSNIHFWLQDSYWATDSSLKPFLHTWSLAVEEQFYLITPIILIVLHKYPKHMLAFVIAIGVASLAFAQWASTTHPELSFFLLPSRMWELLAGTMLAVMEYQRGRTTPTKRFTYMPSLGLLMIVASFFLFNKDTHHPSLLTLIPVVGTMLIIWFANPTDFSTRILSTSVFVSIGLISYGIYMWHFPIFAFSNIVLAEQLLAPIKLGLIAAVIGISALSYVFIEKPFRTTSIISTKTAMLVGTIVLIPLTVFLYNGMENGYKHRVPALLNAATELEYIPNTTWFETTASRTGSIILAGDSHLQIIAPTVRKMALASGFDYASTNMPGCQLLVGTDRLNQKTLEAKQKCTIELQNTRMAFIRSAPPSYVVLGGRLPLILEESRFNNQEGADEGEFLDFIQNPERSLATKAERNAFIAQQYQITVDQILAQGHTAVLLYPIPEVGWHVPNQLQEIIGYSAMNVSEKIQKNPVTTSYAVFKDRTKSSYALLDAIQGDNIIRIYPEKLFCNSKNSGRCITHTAKVAFYRDEHHLSDAGAKLLATMIFDEIAKSR
jgi:peptidoglycan/LPS O-acetylase OafA/YrhL